MDHLPLLATYESYLILGYLFLILVVAGLIYVPECAVIGEGTIC